MHVSFAWAGLAACLLSLASAASAAAEPERVSGEALYLAACANCHGVDGRGAPVERLGFDDPALPDFTDCRFGPREADADWLAVTHEGGPARAFDRMMPAFGEALGETEIQLVVSHVRTFCSDSRWPRGELNLPLALFTEKAFPEDEVVWRSAVAAEGRGEVAQRLVFEKRLGARHQLEVIVPGGWREVPAGPDGAGGSSDWRSGLGDVAVGIKRVLFHSLERGAIVSVVGEMVLPTGDEDDGFGGGTTVFEPFLAYGQLLPGDAFFQVQGGLELPFESDAADEAFWRAVVGKTWSRGRWGRSFSPMVELLGSREVSTGDDIAWDLVPQAQVTLSTRQHVRANLGVRVPIEPTRGRDAQVVLYLLWDWFDGGLHEGW